MEFYIIIYLLLSVIAIIGSYKRSSIWPICSFIIIVSIQALRWRTGTDWAMYQYMFDVSDCQQVETESGYYYFNKLIRSLTDSYTVFLLIECSIIALCQWIFAKQFHVNNIPATLLYFFSVAVFPVRFTLATAIFLLSYKYICEKKFLRFIIIAGIACLFHQGIVMLIPLYFIVTKEYKIKTLYIIYISCCVMGLMTEFMFRNLSDVLLYIFEYLPSFSQDKASFYMNESENSTETRSLVSSLISFINGAFFIYLFLYCKKKFRFNNNQFTVLLNIYVFGLSLSRLFLNTVPYFARINMACAGGFIIILLWSLQKIKPYYRWVFTSLLCIYMLSSYINRINQYPDLYIPYYSVFSNQQRTYVY